MNARRTALLLLLSLCFPMTGCGMGADGTVEITPRSPTVFANQTVQFSVKVTNCPNTAVDWSVPSGDGTINNAGVYTAPSEPGTYTVKAECSDNSNIYDTVSVTVQ